MIINCKNCNKKFNVDSSLIPQSGREIQCGLCNHRWFFKDEKPSYENLIITENDSSQDTNNDNTEFEIFEKNQDKSLANISSKDPEIKNNNINTNPKSQKKIKTTFLKNFISKLIVFIISFVALIIILETLKTPLINIFPSLEIILFNLFETIKDIKLFIADLT